MSTFKFNNKLIENDILVKVLNTFFKYNPVPVSTNKTYLDPQTTTYYVVSAYCGIVFKIPSINDYGLTHTDVGYRYTVHKISGFTFSDDIGNTSYKYKAGNFLIRVCSDLRYV
jgi:hypothetical protein